MSKHSKRYRSIAEKVDGSKEYSLDDAIALSVETATAKFDETIELAVRLGVDPRQADQNVRGTVVLPHGTGKSVRVLVFAKGEKETEAREAGADYAGSDDLIQKISEGWLEFDRAVATPDMMGAVGKIARILGPRGLMPNPKVGTVTFDVAKATEELKAGKVEYRVEKAGIVHIPIGKKTFGAEKLGENAKTLLDSLIKLKPASAKGSYLRGISISATLGPGIKVDTSDTRNLGA